MLQSVLLSRDHYTLAQAKAFIRRNSLKLKKIDTTKNYYRFRQIDPKGFKRFRTKTIKEGVKFVFAFRGKMAERKKKTRAKKKVKMAKKTKRRTKRRWRLSGVLKEDED